MAERSVRGSWKLTFIVWSGLLLVWAFVTVALDEQSVRLLRRLGASRWEVAVALVALAIGLPLLIDARRNVLRTYRQWKRRATPVSGAEGSDEVPAHVPRRFRGAEMAHHDDLTRRERSLVEHGQLLFGTVVHHAELTSVRATTPWGVEVWSRPVVVDGSRRPAPDTRAALVVEAGAKMGVAPALHHLRFIDGPPCDHRGPLAPQPKPAPCGPFEAAVHTTLHPLHRVAGAAPTEIGTIDFDGDTLTLHAGAAAPVAIRLSRPFTVKLSVQLLHHDRAELNLAVEQFSVGAYRAPRTERLQVKAELDQARLSAELPLGWCDATYLRGEDFDRVWRILAASASDEITSLVKA
ncbi:MAG: hypothetical protein AAF928_02990 [Myxococcota bacterium]